MNERPSHAYALCRNLCQFRQLGCYLTDNVDEVRNSVFFTEEYVGTYRWGNCRYLIEQ